MAGPGPGPGDPDEQYDFLFKLVLVGDASVGKTCVVQRFKTGAFSERQGSTIGVDFTMKTLEIQGKRVKLQIWDTAGQERFRTITQSYYRSANGAILAYDITKRSSFLSVPHWIEDVRKYAGSNIVQLLIASRSSELASKHTAVRLCMCRSLLPDSTTAPRGPCRWSSRGAKSRSRTWTPDQEPQPPRSFPSPTCGRLDLAHLHRLHAFMAACTT
ncbi:ras-related protein Rab-43 isoform X2 [Ursus maritimus]|uniref:Ras-related protein Rab-43 isoform X2 n=1 Tax=Ursus maritimus TaxID=29073 RepID=A0A8M1FVJ8_URSMA|nr:ras-related protein Rab-43 isoform X2 [Ursus maritimus]